MSLFNSNPRPDPHTKEWTLEEIEKAAEKVFGEEPRPKVKEWKSPNGMMISFGKKIRRCKQKIHK